MMEFPNIFLNEKFVVLLCHNFSTVDQSRGFLTRYMEENPDFEKLVSHSFRDVNFSGQVDVLMRILGWVGFRNRLASIFIQYVQDKKYPEKPNLELVQDLIEFDRAVMPYAVRGFSRGFLLAFYLKLGRLSLGESFKVPQEVFSLLGKVKVRVSRIDWVILLLWHFSDSVRVEELDGLLDGREGFVGIEDRLSPIERDKLSTNMLTYSYAINDREFFERRVI